MCELMLFAAEPGLIRACPPGLGGELKPIYASI